MMLNSYLISPLFYLYFGVSCFHLLRPLLQLSVTAPAKAAGGDIISDVFLLGKHYIMSIRSHALAFSSGVHGRSPSCWSKVSHRACRVSTHTRNDATLAALSVTEVQDVRPETAVEPQKGDGVAKLGRKKVSRLEVPFELAGQTGTLHNQQEELQRHITVGALLGMMLVSPYCV